MNNQEWSKYIFMFMLGLGGAVAWFSDEGVTYVYIGNSRQPAAIRRVFDFSHLNGNDLTIASRNRLLADAKLFKTESSIGIELGHFVVKGTSGKKEFACQSFDYIELVFMAQGIAESGQSPRMFIKGECRMGKDISRMAPIWIPMAEVMSQAPSSDVIQYHDRRLTLWFENIGSIWPQNWTLESARLFGEGINTHEMRIDRKKVNEIAKGKISFMWDSSKQSQ